MEYSVILDQCKLFYPNWLSKESAQISQGRLNNALEPLSFVGWIEFEGNLSPRASITVHYSKGDRMRTGIFEFLSKKFVEMQIKKTVEPRRKKGRLPSARALRIKPTKSDSSSVRSFRNNHQSGITIERYQEKNGMSFITIL